MEKNKKQNIRQKKDMYMWPSHWSRPIAYGNGGAISSNSVYATRAGLNILKKGGNAFDAAVAVSLVLSVVEPHHSGIGGGCFSLLYSSKDKKAYALDGRGVAPKRATADLFMKDGEVQDEWKDLGGQSVAIPGLLKTLDVLLNEFGTLTFREVADSAIDIATNGFGVGYTQAITMNDNSVKRKLALSPSMRKLYLKENDDYFKFGEIQKNLDLAYLLKEICNRGVEYFYSGSLGKRIVDLINERGGCFNYSDLEEYKPKFRKPISSTYRDTEVISFAPPSGGSTVIEMLNILENVNLNSLGHNTSNYIHYVAETMKICFADRSKALGDPDFVKVDTDTLTSKEFAKQRFDQIGNVAMEFDASSNLITPEYLGNTSHFSIMDSMGNVVSQTQTIRDWFGCGIVVDGFGFVLNNAMSDFSSAEGTITSQGLSYGKSNCIEGGKTPLSSMSPCILLRNSEPFLSIGAAGGPRIITGTLQGILNAVDFQMNTERLVNSPYIHIITKEQGLEVEYGISNDTLIQLEEKNHYILKNAVNEAMSTMLNSVMKIGDEYFASGTGRIDGCGGALVNNSNIVLEGITQELINK